MPIYEYRCNSCYRTIEQLQRMSDPDILKFDGCNSQSDCELHRILSVCVNRANGIEPDYTPPTAQSPIGNTVTRDWMDAGGNLTPMKEGEWNKEHVGINA